MKKNIDPQRFGKVAVIMGGDSDEREVSFMSGEGVLAALKKQGIDAHPFDTATQNIFALREQGFDRAMIMVHGVQGDDGQIQASLELLKIPYTGSGVLASSLSFDKIRSKLYWSACGLPVLPTIIINDNTTFQLIADQIDAPFIIKPSRAGSSQGITIVKKPEDFNNAVEDAKKFDTDVFAEPYIDCDDLTVAILNDEAFPPIKIVASGEFYDYDAKYIADDTQYVCPPDFSEDEITELQTLALKAFKTIEARHWGRVDFLRDQDGKFWLMEMNVVPGMTSHSLVPMAAKAVGIDYDQLVIGILGQTLDS